MRYALIFAGVAAASYDAYGHDGYGENQASSSTPAIKYPTSTPAAGGYEAQHPTYSAPAPSKSSTSSKIGYTTIYPGYGKQPVTVTSQYQPYPTCGAAGANGKSCEHWGEDKYVSTVLTNCEDKKVTVTHVEQPVTVYHTKTTITHYPTASAHGGKGGNAYPTGSYGYGDNKNSTKPWYEMYEKVHEIKYKELGAHGLPGYGGSGLCKSCDDEQPYKVKEYKNGKWNEYEATAIYKAPTPEVKTYTAPGVYTEPAKDVTVTYSMTKPAEATTTAHSGVPVTYGGVTTEFKETGVKTCAYGAYETGKDQNGQDVTSTVVKTVTVTVSTTGKYEVAKPTTTVYDHDTEVAYPTVSVYKPGVYHKDAQTVTITKAGQTASCEYKQTQTYPAGPKETPSHGGEYPHGEKSSSKPSVNTKTGYQPEYPASTPAVSKSSSKPVGEYPGTSSAPSYPEYPASSSTPAYNTEMSSSTPCSSSTPAVETKTSSLPSYETSSVPSYPATSSVPQYKTSTVPQYEISSVPQYKTSSVPHYETSTVPHGASSTPCESSSTPAVNTKTSSYPSYETSSVPRYETSSVPSHKTSSVPSYPVTSSVPHGASSTPCESSSTPAVNTKTSSYPVYETSSVPSHKTSSVPSYPVTSSVPHYETSTVPHGASSTPCETSSTPAAKTSSYPAYETSSVPSYNEHKSSSSVPSYPATSTVPHYEASSSTPCPSSTAPAEYHQSSVYPVAPAASSSAPAYEAYTPVPTPAKSTPAYPAASSAYPEKGNGYSKRAGAVQRRQAMRA